MKSNLADEVFSKVYGISITEMGIPEKNAATEEETEIKNEVIALMPFIKESLLNNRLVTYSDGKRLSDFIDMASVQFLPDYKEYKKSVVFCRAVAFQGHNPATVERVLFSMNPFLIMNYGVAVSRNVEPLLGGFENLSKDKNKRRMCTARFYLAEEGVI